AAQRLDLVEVGGVLRAGQGRGRSGAELGAALHRERGDEGDVHVGGRAEVRRGRLPLAGVGVRRRVGHDRGGAVAGAQGQDRRGALLAEGAAGGGPARGNARQVLGQGRVEDRLPRRVEGGQRVVGRLGGGRLLGGAAGGVDVGGIGLVGPVDGVDGVEHGD